MDLNCKDSNGKSALVIALENERLECLETLLDFGVKIGDALLYAIKKQQVSAVKILFGRMRPGFGYKKSFSINKKSENRVNHVRTMPTCTRK